MSGKAFCWDCKRPVRAVEVSGSPWQLCPHCKRKVSFSGMKDSDRASGEYVAGKLVIKE